MVELALPAVRARTEQEQKVIAAEIRAAIRPKNQRIFLSFIKNTLN